MLRWGGCEGRGRDDSMRSEHVSGGGVGGGGARETGWGCLLVGGRGKVHIEANRIIPTHGGASHEDFVKVSSGQRGAGEVHPIGADGAL